MKLWRGEPEHSHWKRLLSARDRAYMGFGAGAIGFGMAIVQYQSPGSGCQQGGRSFCTIVRALASVSGTSVPSAEVTLWLMFGIGFTVAGLLQWRQR